MKQHRWLIRGYREGDEEGIFELWQAVHPSERIDRDGWMTWWRWMYQETPYGSAIWLAEDNRKIVGQYCTRIVNLKYGNDVVKAAHSLNTATHPDYQRQGIMSKLSKKTFDELAQDSIYITYGFPNEIAYPNDIKLGFLDIAPLKSMIKVFNWEKFLSQRIHNTFLLNFGKASGIVAGRLFFKANTIQESNSVSQVFLFDERINEFWNNIFDPHPIVVVRSDEYLNWRYVTAPGKSYSIFLYDKGKQIGGYLVLRYIQVGNARRGLICEIFADSRQSTWHLLHKATVYCLKEGMDDIVWNGIANKSFLRLLREMGFINLPFQKNLSRFVVYPGSPDISLDFIENPQNWLVQAGDADTS